MGRSALGVALQHRRAGRALRAFCLLFGDFHENELFFMGFGAVWASIRSDKVQVLIQSGARDVHDGTFRGYG